MFALDFLRVVFTYSMLLWIEVTRIRSPPIGVIARDAKRFEQLFQLQKDIVLSAPKDVRSYLATVVINGVPQPTRMRFRLHKTPHFVELGAQSTTHLKLIRTPDFHLDLLGIYD